ncbi:MAG: ATP-binding cassette domain-containing protein [Bacteroidales bacterium]|nr:ATP-binding cassette domain-containing protein [Bacteroidales bacterium]
MEKALIEYNQVSIYQEELCILNKVDLSLKQGEFSYLIGAVGAGKTSLLKSFYAELKIKEGQGRVLDYQILKIKRKQVPKLRRNIGIVFQDFRLLTDRSVHDNLSFVLKATGWKKRHEIDFRIEEVLDLVGMSHKGYKFPYELSGGEQQRIVIARAMLNSPAIILADEPTGNLDLETGRNIVELLHQIAEKGTLVVMSTHNLNYVYEYPGTVLRCHDRELLDVTQEFYESKENN